MRTKIPINILAIENDGYHLFVEVQLNDLPVNMIVDTGASKTVFDYEKIKTLLNHNEFEENLKLSAGLGTTTMRSFIFEIKKLQIGDCVINNYSTVAMDLSNVNESYRNINLPEIVGVLGSDVLFYYKAVINYRLKLLSLKLRAKS